MAKQKQPKTQPVRSFKESEPISAAVGQRLHDMGFTEVERPDFGIEDLKIPTSGLSSLPSHQLGDLYTRCGAVVSYLTSVTGSIELERLVAEHRYEQARATALARLRVDPSLAKTSVAEKKALADADPEVLRIQTELVKATALVKRATTMLEAHRVTWQTLSREITRQSHDVTTSDVQPGNTGPRGGRNVVRN